MPATGLLAKQLKEDEAERSIARTVAECVAEETLRRTNTPAVEYVDPDYIARVRALDRFDMGEGAK